MESLNSVIMTVLGIGAVNGTCILDEINYINHFSKSRKLLTYVSLDPTVRQSGQFSEKSTRISTRGSALLRYALINAAWQLTLNDQIFNCITNSKSRKDLTTMALSVTLLINLYAFSLNSSAMISPLFLLNFQPNFLLFCLLTFHS